MAEAGMPEFDLYTWFGLFAPAGTPPEAVARIQREVVAALKSPDVLERFAAVGAEPVGSTPAEFVERIRSDAASWAEVIKTANIKAQWMRLLDAPLAIVDLETTGADPASDRITEVAVLTVESCGRVAEWSTLVNPGSPIPGTIQMLTGITNEMVAAAPRFDDIAAELLERLQGRIFVAHNARFDYGFLRRELGRTGHKFSAKTLCTVRLSRRLYPAEPRHNLDSLIARHDIACRARHRAAGDADAVWQFLRIAEQEHGEEVVAVAARQIAKQPALPPQLDRALVDEVPEAPGVYLLFGEETNPSISARAHRCAPA